jgi:hypothetical protein
MHCAEICKKIMRHLPRWSLEVGDWGQHAVRISHDDSDAAISVRLQKNRLEITGIYPRGPRGKYHSASSWGALPYDAQDPRITVSATRSAATIASEISRRLLPVYLELFIRCLQKKRELEEYEAKKQSAIERYAEILGTEVRTDTARLYAHDGNIYGNVRCNSDTTAQIEFSLPHDLTEKVLQVIADYTAAKKEVVA